MQYTQGRCIVQSAFMFGSSCQMVPGLTWESPTNITWTPSLQAIGGFSCAIGESAYAAACVGTAAWQLPGSQSRRQPACHASDFGPPLAGADLGVFGIPAEPVAKPSGQQAATATASAAATVGAAATGVAQAPQVPPVLTDNVAQPQLPAGAAASPAAERSGLVEVPPAVVAAPNPCECGGTAWRLAACTVARRRGCPGLCA